MGEAHTAPAIDIAREFWSAKKEEVAHAQMVDPEDIALARRYLVRCVKEDVGAATRIRAWDDEPSLLLHTKGYPSLNRFFLPEKLTGAGDGLSSELMQTSRLHLDSGVSERCDLRHAGLTDIELAFRSKQKMINKT